MNEEKKSILSDEEKQKIRSGHKQLAKDFGYHYDEKLDQNFITINEEVFPIPVNQKYRCPLSDEEFVKLKDYEADLEQKNIPDILKNPDFLNIINREVDKKAVGELEARRVMILETNMRNVENVNKGSDNLIVNAAPGTGKDHLTTAVFELIPEEEKEELIKTTPKVLGYTRNRKIQPDATWKKSSLRMEDVEKSVVNDGSFKVFLSADPNRINKGKTINKGKVMEIEIEGKPSIILTLADMELSDQNLRRLPTIYLNEGINQTRAVLRRQAEYAEKGTPLEYSSLILEAIKRLKRVKVKIPFAMDLIPIFEQSLENVIVRTAFPRFLDYIKSSASLFQYQRKIDFEGYVVATEEDYKNGIMCLKRTTSNIFMIPLGKLDQSIYNFFKTRKIERVSIDELYDFPEIQHLGKSDRWIRYRCDWLVSKGFLKRESEKVEGVFRPMIKYSLIEIREFKIPTLEELKKTSNTSLTSFTSNTSNTSNSQVFEQNEVFETKTHITGLDQFTDSEIKEAGYTRAELEEVVKPEEEE